ncbi:MAG: pyruvate kinase alpha/beta domain-containing protein [Candidatus Bathyarchaeia archaeon]
MFRNENIRYFDEPGPKNTEALIGAVKERIKNLKIEHVVVASESGVTALKVADALKEFKVKIVCVSAYAGIRRAYPESGKWPSITNQIRKRLENLGVKILEETPYIFKGVTFDSQFLGRAAPSWAIHEFLSRAMGYGFKTALEVTMIAAEAGAVPIDREIIAIAGTGWLGGGADCAIVIKPSVIPKITDVERGLEVREIIAIPRTKFNEKLIDKLKKEKETV